MEYNELKKKIESAKVYINRAEGVKEQLFSRLKNEFGFKSLEETASGKKEIDSEISNAKAKKAELENKLQNITDWSVL
ncbi:MAG: hypothetical protein ACFFG0_02420 [Candidatus Thorarchaeota archaeon]